MALGISLIAISLGASLGILSGRGAYAGMVSASLMAIITSLLGGTRLQCSGPTPAMSTVTGVMVAFALSETRFAGSALNADQFMTLVMLQLAAFMILFSALRLGRFVELIPNVIVSGFMSGVGLLICIGQVKLLLNLNPYIALGGDMAANIMVALCTCVIGFFAPAFWRYTIPKAALFLPSTLVAIISLTVLTHAFGTPAGYIEMGIPPSNGADWLKITSDLWPANAAFSDFALAFPYALKLSLLCYFDTLLTATVIDSANGEQTKRNKELFAQGLSNAVCAMAGGIPGAQATTRSMLMIKEGAQTRACGVMAGIFMALQMILFQDIFSLIPAAVFSGILLKVGFDIFDWMPFRIYAAQCLRRKRHTLKTVSHTEILFVVATMLTTLIFDLNAAVIVLTALFYILNNTFFKARPIADLGWVNRIRARHHD